MKSPTPRGSVVILISGRGGNMRALIERSRDAGAPYAVSKVFSDQADAAGLDLARGLGVPAEALNPAAAANRADASTRAGASTRAEARAAYDAVLAAAVKECSPSLVVLAGFMRILSAQFVAEFAGKMLNIHPSLLPKYPGLHTHRRALQARDPEHGATVHFVTEELDGGPPVIQARVRVTAADDEQSLAARVQTMEHRIYPLAVQWYCQGRLRYADGRAWLDGRELNEPVQFTGAEG
ncbi:MAG: phosphoribosylglycinamide formyltransferase [Steroidobacteraceae bacterium]